MDLNFEILRNDFKIAIKQALKKQNVSVLEEKQKGYTKTDIDLKTPLDQAFRDVLLEFIETEIDVKILEQLINLCIESCRLNLATLSMPVNLLADIFDLLTLDFCEKMFTYVERNVNVWKEELFFSSCKNILLRMCNDLLRKLSRSTATVFCGRILLFLAKFFPFSERSGLNIVSEFNLENITEVEVGDLETLKKEKETADNYIDYNLYCKFWALQDFFRNPTQCYNTIRWKVFCAHSTDIINTFQYLKLEHVDKESSWTLTQKNEDNKYFSKYLTNRKLLDLQLYDVNFRRFILLQFLILFQYLSSTIKSKTSYDLSTEQKEWIQDITHKIYGLLKETPPDGERFSKIVSDILNREQFWNAWKKNGCPEFRKSLSSTATMNDLNEKKKTENKQFLGDVINEANRTGTYYMGNSELTKLWNLYPDNLDACKAKDRNFLPSLESYFAEAIDQLDNPDLGKDNLLKDGNFGWRALRLLARKSPHFFTNSNKPISELHSYLEMMVQKITADKPGNVEVEVNEQNDAEIEDDLFKQPEDANDDIKNSDSDGDFIQFKVTIMTLMQFNTICEKLASSWKILANKLGYKPDEIQYIESQHSNSVEQARNLLHLWFEDDDDSTLENFLYILEGLELREVAEEVKLAIEQDKNVND